MSERRVSEEVLANRCSFYGEIEYRNDDMNVWLDLRDSRAENARLRELLREIEWGGHNGECPSCAYYPGAGHQSDCRLAAELEGR